MNNEATQSSSEDSSPFPRTMWTVVLEASGEDDAAAAEAMSKLCGIYHDPVLAWLKRQGYPDDKARDLTQGFMEYLLKENRLQKKEEGRQGFKRQGQTKFRSFLLKCLKGYAHDLKKRGEAGIRGGGVEALDLDSIEVGAETDVDQTLDLDLALTVHRRACEKLQTGKYAQPSKAARFEELRHFIWVAREDISYGEVAQRLATTVGNIKKAVFDLRHAYYDAFRAEVAQIVTLDLQEAETKYLMKLVAGQLARQGPPN